MSARVLLPLVGLFCLGTLTGCGDDPETIFAETVEKQQEINAILKQVDDEESAERAVGEIEQVMKDLMRIKDRADAITPPTPEQEKELWAKYGDQMAAGRKTTREELLRIKEDQPAVFLKLQAMLADLE